MVEAVSIPREKFPKSNSCVAGMIPLKVCCDHADTVYQRDIPYREREGRTLYLQLLLHPFAQEKAPLILYIQGSAWHKQNVIATLPQLAALAARGFVVASLEYTPSELAPFPAQLMDAKAALRFVRARTEEYGIDPQRIYVMGDSSGGHTALLLGLTAGLPEFEEEGEPSVVNGVIDFYGPVDISKMNEELSAMDHIQPDSPEGYLIGRKHVLKHPELVAPTVVTNYITPERNLPPIFIAHGTNDELVALGQSCLLYERLRACGKEARFYALEGAHHGGKEFWCTQMLDLVSNFIRSGRL